MRLWIQSQNTRQNSMLINFQFLKFSRQSFFFKFLIFYSTLSSSTKLFWCFNQNKLYEQIHLSSVLHLFENINFVNQFIQDMSNRIRKQLFWVSADKNWNDNRSKSYFDVSRFSNIFLLPFFSEKKFRDEEKNSIHIILMKKLVKQSHK